MTQTPEPASAWRPAQRAKIFSLLLIAVFAVLGARVVQLSLSGEGDAPRRAAARAEAPRRADIVDRNGVLLATTLPSYTLAVSPTPDVNPDDVARLAQAEPRLTEADIRAKLSGPGQLVYLLPGLTPSQRQKVHDLGIRWVRFEETERRVYPNRELAGHVLGGVNRDGVGTAGVERALDERLAAGGRAARLSLDLRIQHAAEAELASAVEASQAIGGAAMVIDGRSGEVLAMASRPTVDPNGWGSASESARRSRLTGSLYDVGSTIKPLIAAMALETGVVNESETFDLTQPFRVPGKAIRDDHPFGPRARLRDAIAHSSNQVMAEVALRVGDARQRDFLERAGFLDADPVEGVRSEPPLPPREHTPLVTATLGYGYGASTTLAALAGAYTVFVNDGARVRPSLYFQDAGVAPPAAPVFSPETAHRTLDLMREVVLDGTASRAALEGFDIAGKTGTALKLVDGVYDQDHVLASFVGVMPARAPRYVVLVAIDEPQRLAENQNLITGGALAAPVVGRIAARMAPFVAMTSASADGERQAFASGGAFP